MASVCVGRGGEIDALNAQSTKPLGENVPRHGAKQLPNAQERFAERREHHLPGETATAQALRLHPRMHGLAAALIVALEHALQTTIPSSIRQKYTIRVCAL